MGIQERKERQLAEREQLFLDAAREQILQDGLLGLQMAKVARACDYATGTLYQHFASKEDLLVAICGDLVEKRVEIFNRLPRWKAPSRERILGIAVGDIIFAHHYPEHFKLAQFVFTEVVWQAASPKRRSQLLETSRPMGEAVRQIIDDAVAAGDLDTHGRPVFEMTLGQWTMTLGMHNLVHAEGVLELYNLHDPYRILLRQLNALLNGLGWQPLMDPFDEAALEQLVTRIQREVFADLCDSTTDNESSGCP
ncbi:MAG: TetR family transcriptional regulator [Gammaproteobacteria bacterium HGW-Gammaproteobacteria-14]|nr:MAG: TetR family transcriptional regulator [Gammaproteobacteria bacterium HGW-Gammaproteobacteria-14]